MNKISEESDSVLQCAEEARLRDSKLILKSSLPLGRWNTKSDKLITFHYHLNNSKDTA